MKTLKIFLFALVVIGTATVAAINVALNSNTPIISNWTLQNMEASTNESGEGGNLADNANNGSGWLWRSYYSNCVIAEKLVVTSACGSFTVNAIYYTNTVTLRSQITACGGSYTYTTNEPGMKKYCIDGWNPFCTENTTCH